MSSERGVARFDTAIGCCRIGWSAVGVASVRLPGPGPGPGARGEVPDGVRRAIDGIRALLGGEPVDLGFVQLDADDVPEFNRRVYDVARAIPPGCTLTYGQVANRLGEPGAARAVGRALGQNPFPLVVPCHRVLAAGGKIGGFSAPGGVATKRRLLAIEGAAATPPSLFDAAPPTYQ